MSKEPDIEPSDRRAAFSRQVGARETRKLRARRRPQRSVWSGFGVFGLIGWSVVAPTLLGVGAGIWLDRHYPGAHSWTLILLIAGLTLGCMNAWRWVAREQKEMREEHDNDDE